MYPLTNLIVIRGFDRFQEGLKARFSSNNIQYQLIYGKLTLNTVMRLEFETRLHLAAIYVWESGLCDLEIYEISSGERVLCEHHELSSEDEFHGILPKVFVFIRDALESSI